METERSVMRSYPTGSRGREMSGDHHDRAIGEGLEEAPPCRSRQRPGRVVEFRRRTGVLIPSSDESANLGPPPPQRQMWPDRHRQVGREQAWYEPGWSGKRAG